MISWGLIIVFLMLIFKTRQRWLFKRGTLHRINQRDAIGNSIKLSQGNCHYVLRGPPQGELVVFIHGISVPSETYLALELDKFYTEKGFRFLILDLYGRGYSDSPDTCYTPELFSGQLAELLFNLNIQEPVHLVGLSMGGGVALHFAKTYPERVKKLVLLSSVGYKLYSYGYLQLFQIPILGEFLFKIVAFNTIVRNYPKEIISFLLRVMDPVSYEELELNKKDKQEIEDYNVAFNVTTKHVRENSGLLRSIYSTLKYFPLDSMGDTIKDISQNPRDVLIIHGDSDSTIPYESALETHNTLKNSSLITFKGGHNIIVDSKKDVNQKITEFLSK